MWGKLRGKWSCLPVWTSGRIRAKISLRCCVCRLRWVSGWAEFPADQPWYPRDRCTWHSQTSTRIFGFRQDHLRVLSISILQSVHPMVRFAKIVMVIAIMGSCTYRTYELNGESVFVGSPHRLFKESDSNYHDILDTNAIYYEALFKHGSYLKFDSDGWLTRLTLFKTDSLQVSPDSADRGRYCMRKNKIRIELFWPGDTYFDNHRLRSVDSGIIRGDSLILKARNGQPGLYVKSQRYYIESGAIKEHVTGE